jgi:hypothetical protein
VVDDNEALLFTKCCPLKVVIRVGITRSQGRGGVSEARCVQKRGTCATIDVFVVRTPW